MADVVLVHGTTQSARGYGRLAAALEDQGHRALTPRVPSAAASTAEQYAELIIAQLPADLDRPVVAAHSAAGLLLPALAQDVGARHQVWLAAAVADFAGARSFQQELQQDPHAVVNPEWVGIDPTTDRALATYFLFHDADLPALRVALSTLAACDLSTVYAEVPTRDPAQLPSTYVLPIGDRTLSQAWMGRIARERLGVEPVEVSGGHNSYAASPQVIAAIIDAAAP